MQKNNFDAIAEILQKSFIPEKAQGVRTTVQINISEIEDGLWNMQISDQKCRITRGLIENPNVSAAVSYENLIKLIRNELSPAMAMLKRKIRITGNLSELTGLLNLFAFNQADLGKAISLITEA